MSRLSIETPGRAQSLRWSASGYGAPHWCQCLRTVSGGYVFELPAAVPCADLWEMCARRIGLGQLEVLIEQVLDRTATMETINIIERTAKGDCRFRRLCDWL